MVETYQRNVTAFRIAFKKEQIPIGLQAKIEIREAWAGK